MGAGLFLGAHFQPVFVSQDAPGSFSERPRDTGRAGLTGYTELSAAAAGNLVKNSPFVPGALEKCSDTAAVSPREVTGWSWKSSHLIPPRSQGRIVPPQGRFASGCIVDTFKIGVSSFC